MSDTDWKKIRLRLLGDFTVAELPPTLELPALPLAVTRFLEKAGDQQIQIGELAGILETDTGLTVELLRYVNSSLLGLRHKATGVQQALALLGLRRSKMFVMSTGMQAAVRARQSKLINQNCFWNASLQKALFAREVAKLLKANEDMAFAGALMQDYLLPILTNMYFEAYLDFVSNRAQHPMRMSDWEKGRFGWDHAIAAASLAHRWHFPDELVCCIASHNDGLQVLGDAELRRSSVAAVALSAMIPDQLRQNYRGLELLLKLQEKWPAFDLEELASRVDSLQDGNQMGIRNDFPLGRRCRQVFTEDVFQDGCLNSVVTA